MVRLEDGTLCVDILLVHEVNESFILMCALEVVSQLIIVDDERVQNAKALHVVLERLYKRSEAILCIKVQDKILVFFFENALQLLCLLRLDRMLAVAGHLA